MADIVPSKPHSFALPSLQRCHEGRTQPRTIVSISFTTHKNYSAINLYQCIRWCWPLSKRGADAGAANCRPTESMPNSSSASPRTMTLTFNTPPRTTTSRSSGGQWKHPSNLSIGMPPCAGPTQMLVGQRVPHMVHALLVGLLWHLMVDHFPPCCLSSTLFSMLYRKRKKDSLAASCLSCNSSEEAHKGRVHD
jgi:hypothetical protein